MQPRLTARLVVPTPPMAPATAMIWLPRGRVSPEANRRSLIRPNAASKSSIRTGWVRNSFAPARIARKINCPSFEELTTSTAQSGEVSLKRPIRLRALAGSASRPIMPMSGLVWATTSAKNS